MPNQPIDKVRFKKRDIVALHDLPSAKADDPIVVRGHHPRGLRRSAFRWLLGAVVLLLLAGGGFLVSLEAGLVDGFIRDRARSALAQAVGPDNLAELTSAAVRLTSRGQLALEARDVLIEPRNGSARPSRVDRVLISLDPLALLKGRISVTSVDISGVGLITPEQQGFDLTDLAGFRVDATGEMIETLFAGLNRIASQIENVEAGMFRFSDVRISGNGPPTVIENAIVRRLDGLTYNIEADLLRAGRSIAVRGTATAKAAHAGLSEIRGKIDGLAIDFLNEGWQENRSGLKTDIGITFRAARADTGSPAALNVTVIAADGTMTMGGVEAELREARIKFVYMPLANKIEITPSIIRVGETVLPFTGGLIDADRVDQVEGDGIAFDFVIKRGLAAPGDSDEPPIEFDGKALGRFDAANRLLVAEELAVASSQGGMLGSASWRFVEGKSPEINLVAEAPAMSTAAVKQLWPYWMGKRARQWVLDNLYGGSVSNGRIQLAVPAGHYGPDEPKRFGENQLQIDFDIERARMNVAGDIPPLRDTVAHIRLRGSRVDVSVSSATAFFPTGRSVDISDATFSIPAADEQPLMAELAMAVSGDADAVAELITYHPINALERIGLKPEDLSGTISSTVTARFGLLREQSPPPPAWTVELRLSGVDIGEAVEGRSLTKLDGTLYVTPERADLKADALVDGARMKLDVTQPVGDSGVAMRRKISGTLSPEAREKLAPGTGTLISGPVGFVMEVGAKGERTVNLDLKTAKLTVPGTGWTKDVGIAATLGFVMQTDGAVTKLTDLRLSGKGFEASGVVSIKDGGLSTADFDHVALSPRDNYSASIKRSGTGYKIELGGSAIDARPIIALAKSAAAQAPANDANAAPIEISGKVGKVHGYSDEGLSSGIVRYKGQGGRIDLLDFKAVTQSGQALVLAVSGDKGGETIEITSGDAGAFARFSGVYSRIRGGLLNVRLNRQGGPLRRGVVDLRNFEVVGEPRLNSLVSTPSPKDGRSLRDAVKTDIQVSQAEFEMANVRVVSGNGQLSIVDGVLRGPQIGASFQGKVYDAQGRMDMTGTFMPAYGVNRLFAELPLIGVILGNGRDRGLIGITFRLAGQATSPELEVNPLSVIAPGVFRSIFEFRP